MGAKKIAQIYYEYKNPSYIGFDNVFSSYKISEEDIKKAYQKAYPKRTILSIEIFNNEEYKKTA